MQDSDIVVTTTADKAGSIQIYSEPKSEPQVEKPATEVSTDETPAENLEASEPQTEVEKPEGEKPEGEQTEKPKKKNGFKKRIAKLSAKVSSLEEEREFWRMEAQKLQTRGADIKQADTKRPEGKPRAEDFEKHEQFVEALAEWTADQKIMARERESKQAQLKSEVQAQISKHLDRVNDFKSEHDDFDEVIDSVSDIALPPHVQEAIIDSEISAELMYELSKDSDTLERIAQMGPRQAAKEIGKFEARIEAKRQPEKNPEIKTTKAPKPITPVGATAASTKSLEDLDYDDYYTARMAQLKPKRRA